MAFGSATKNRSFSRLAPGSAVHLQRHATLSEYLCRLGFALPRGSRFTAWIMPRICVDKAGRNNIGIKSRWITRNAIGSDAESNQSLGALHNLCSIVAHLHFQTTFHISARSGPEYEDFASKLKKIAMV